MSAIKATSRAAVQWSESDSVPPGGCYRIFGDGGTGAVDYTRPLHERPAWPDRAGWSAFGSGLFGEGQFGWPESYGGLFGEGLFGDGLFGTGAPVLSASWTSGPLADGTYQFAVVGVDPAGNPSPAAGGTIASVTLAGTPAAAGMPKATAYDAITHDLTIAWATSPDDV